MYDTKVGDHGLRRKIRETADYVYWEEVDKDGSESLIRVNEKMMVQGKRYWVAEISVRKGTNALRISVWNDATGYALLAG